MKNMSKKTTQLLLIIGLFIIALSQIIFHYVKMPDLAKGSIVGIGLGLSLLSMILRKTKVA
jgi:hypothetical protein